MPLLSRDKRLLLWLLLVEEGADPHRGTLGPFLAGVIALIS
jgi:hypothetical protein